MAKRFNVYPWRVRVLRAWQKLVLPSSKRHHVNYFPSMKLAGANVTWGGEIVFSLQAWEAFPSSDKKMLVVGSGPSIESQLAQLSVLDTGEFNIVLLNGAIDLLIQGVIASALCVIIEDARFVGERIELLRRLPSGTRLILSYSALHALCFHDLSLANKNSIWLMDSVLYPYDKRALKLSELPPSSVFVVNQANTLGLSLDLAEGHFGCGTVMYAGIQLAFTLKVEELYLAGFDLTNFNQPRFYETKANAAWTGLANAYKSRILPAMELVKEVSQERGMAVFNCSHTSIIPRDVIPFHDLLMPTK